MSKTTDPLQFFGDDGQVKTPEKTSRQAPTASAPNDPWLTNEAFYLGVPVRTEAHPMIPSARIVEEYANDLSDEETQDLLKLLAHSDPTLIFGGHGTGKTEMVKFVNARLRRPMWTVQGRAQLEWEDFVGRYNPDDTGAGHYDKGPLVLAMEAGGTLLIDEAASISQGILNGLNEVGNGGNLTVTNKNGYEVIEPRPGFGLVATMNPWDKYGGNNRLNIAYLDRFAVRRKKYMRPDAEMGLLGEKFPRVDAKIIRNLVNFAVNLRDRAEKDTESDHYTVSTRMLQTVCRGIEKYDLSPIRSLESNVFSIIALVAPDQLPAIQTVAMNIVGTK